MASNKETTPTHFLVIRSPHAQQILCGKKKREYRAFHICKMLAGKTVALAVAKSPKSPEGGKIIGHVTFGTACQNPIKGSWEGHPIDLPDCGEPFVRVASFELWPESEWLPSPGGLGLRPLPPIANESE